MLEKKKKKKNRCCDISYKINIIQIRLSPETGNSVYAPLLTKKATACDTKVRIAIEQSLPIRIRAKQKISKVESRIDMRR